LTEPSTANGRSAKAGDGAETDGATDTGASAGTRGGSDAWVYLLRCRDGSLYTGWTTDLERRLARHQAGVASKYTASRLPVELAMALPMPDRTAARREEARIKRLDRAGRLALLDQALTER
jgi:putative endonuclease